MSRLVYRVLVEFLVQEDRDAVYSESDALGSLGAMARNNPAVLDYTFRDSAVTDIDPDAYEEDTGF